MKKLFILSLLCSIIIFINGCSSSTSQRTPVDVLKKYCHAKKNDYASISLYVIMNSHTWPEFFRENLFEEEELEMAITKIDGPRACVILKKIIVCLGKYDGAWVIDGGYSKKRSR